jgi:YD repeat-containing protein
MYFNDNLAAITDRWNARNQLASITSSGFAASFTYDSFGRRTGKTIQGTTVTANLLTGLGIDEFFTRTDGVGVRALLPDALGSTVALGGSTGTLQTQYTYEPFGYATQTDLASSSSYKYTGREDDGTGLYYYRAQHTMLQLLAGVRNQILMPLTQIRNIGLTHGHLSPTGPAPIEMVRKGAAPRLGHDGFEANDFVADPFGLGLGKNPTGWCGFAHRDAALTIGSTIAAMRRTAGAAKDTASVS